MSVPGLLCCGLRKGTWLQTGTVPDRCLFPAGKKTIVIATEETKNRYQADVILSIGEREKEEEIARHLYGILRECDTLGAQAIYSESFATPKMGQAIMNRLLKAAGHEVVQV